MNRRSKECTKIMNQSETLSPLRTFVPDDTQLQNQKTKSAKFTCDSIRLKSFGILLKTIPNLHVSLLGTLHETKYMSHFPGAQVATRNLPLLKQVIETKNTILFTKLLLETTTMLNFIEKRLFLTLNSVKVLLEANRNMNLDLFAGEYFQQIQNITKMVTVTYKTLISMSIDVTECFKKLTALIHALPLQFLFEFGHSNSLQPCLHYCKSVMSHSDKILKNVLKLYFITTASKPKLIDKNDTNSFVHVLYSCYYLCRSIKGLYTNMYQIQSMNNIAGKQTHLFIISTKKKFRLMKPWDIKQPIKCQILDNSLVYLISEAANLRVSHLATSMTNLLYSDDKEHVSKKNCIIHNNFSDANGRTELQNKSTDLGKANVKAIQKNLDKRLKQISVREEGVFLNLLDAIFSINALVLHRDRKASDINNSFGRLPYILCDLQKTKVHWETNLTPSHRDYLRECYMEILWNGVKNSLKTSYKLLCISCKETKKRKYMGLNNFSFNKMVVEALYECISRLNTGTAISEELIDVLSVLIFEIKTLHGLQQWDKNISNAIVTLAKDRFRFVETPEPQTPCSQTFSLVLCSKVPIKDLLITLRDNRSLHNKKPLTFHRTNIQNCVLNPLLTSVNFLNFSLHTKRQQFLTSASWEPFFIITSVDIQKILYYDEPVLKIVTDIVETGLDSNFFELGYLNNIIECWQAFNTSSLRMMLRVLENRSMVVWKSHMPVGKVWKRRGASRQVYQANSYVNIAVQSIFTPIIDGVSFLSRDESLEIICKCVIPFVRTWMQYILDQRVMFSRFGSMQLEFDFLHFLKWFEQDTFNFSLEELGEIHSLPIIIKMRSAILLLSCQPERKKDRSDEYPALNNSVNAALASSTSAISQVSAETINDGQFESIINEVDLPNKEQWLTLRVKGGNSKRQFLCIT